jgi:hypothetical protein
MSEQRSDERTVREPRATANSGISARAKSRVAL